MWALEVINKMNSRPTTLPQSEVEKLKKEVKELKSTVSELKKKSERQNENS